MSDFGSVILINTNNTKETNKNVQQYEGASVFSCSPLEGLGGWEAEELLSLPATN